MSILNSCGEGKDGDRKRLDLKKHWIKNGLVGPKTRNGLNKFLAKVKASGGIIPATWNERGQPPKLTTDELREIAAKLRTMKGKTTKRSNFEKLVVEKIAQKLRDKGLSTLGADAKPSDDTIRTMMAMLVLMGEQDALEFAPAPKTNTRYTAENSLMSAMAFGTTVAGTHFIVGSETAGRELPAKVSPGAQKMIDLVKKANNGAEVRCVQPQYIFSTDDTTQYIFEGADKHGNGTWRLCNPDDLAEKGTRGLYENTDVNNMNGFRVKHTFTFSAAGQLAPFYTTISGLSEKELPVETCPSGMLVMEVPGLAVGSDVDPSNNLPGYVVFLRKTGDNSLDKRKHKHYNDVAFIPHLQRTRQQWGGLEIGSDSDVTEVEIPLDQTAVRYFDGEHAQMGIITEEEMLDLYERLRLIANKQSAARSGSEQAADLSKLFQLLKKYGKITTTPEMTPLKRNLINAFRRDCKDKVKLPKSHEDALIDFLASLPGILQKIATKQIIRQGFVECGIIDDVSYAVPDLDRIVKTTRRKLSAAEGKTFVDEFPALLNVFYENGHLTDNVMEQHGLPLDVDREGNIVRRDATISGESFQRAKCITHKVQCRLRKELLDAAAAKAREKIAKDQLEQRQRYQLNRECEDKLKPTDGELSLGTATIEMFSKPLARELKAFYHVRKGCPPEDGGWPNKGSAEEARMGISNLILLAYECRNEPVLPDPDNEPDDETNESNEEDESDDESDDDMPDNNDNSDCFQTYTATPLNLAQCRFVVTDEWIASVKNAFNPGQMYYFEPFTAEQLQPRVDTLTKILWSRLGTHIRTRVPDKNDMRDSWVWNFVRENLGRVAAMMILVQHIRENLDGIVLRSDVCLLRSPQAASSKMLLLSDGKGNGVTAVQKLHGCYLPYNSDAGFWIRSGTATGQTLEKRNKQHKKGALLADDASIKSRYYTQYPSRHAKVDTTKTRIAFHEDVHVYCGLCFDGKDKVVRRNLTDDSIFKWSDATSKRIRALKWKRASEETKRVHMAGYLIELVYDLCIAPANNVSESPGIELPLGIHAKNKKNSRKKSS